MNFQHFNIDQSIFFDKKKLKLAGYPLDAQTLMITIQNPLLLSKDEKTLILKNIKSTNMCFFQIDSPESFAKEGLLQLTNQLGLVNSDGNLCADTNHITSIEDQKRGVKAGYIPFSNKALTWHTDGYYNNEVSQVRGMVLYCAQSAAKGGESLFYDHERLFFELYEENPGYIDVLTDSNVLVIPENATTKGYYRPAQPGPVFSIGGQGGTIHMRYSARKRNIKWGEGFSDSKGAILKAALQKISSLLSEDNPYIYKLKLQAGQGVICNNVLHNRTAFEDNENARLFYRARFYNHIG